jgi:hypothetical protein
LDINGTPIRFILDRVAGASCLRGLKLSINHDDTSQANWERLQASLGQLSQLQVSNMAAPPS